MKYILPKKVEEGATYIVRRYNPKKHAFELVKVEVVEVRENKTPDGKPGAQIIVCRSVKKL